MDTNGPDGSAARRPLAPLMIGLGLLTVLVFLFSVGTGQVRIPVPDVLQVLAAHLTGRTADVDPVWDRIVWEVRLPRSVLAVVLGAGLALAGAVIQAVVRNPMGDPYLIGIVPGAALGATMVIVAGASQMAGLSVAASAFTGALLAAAATFGLGRQHGAWPPVRLVLAGVAVGYAASAVTFFLQVRATPNEVSRVLFWSLGSVAGADWSDLVLVTAVTVAGGIWLLVQRRRLNALVGGDDLARSLGVDVVRFQVLLMLLVSLVTATAVAVSGGIGFVGLVVPHVARMLLGADHSRVLPGSVLFGAFFLLASDQVARTALAPSELPIGIVTAAFGAPFFMWLLWSNGRRGVTS